MNPANYANSMSPEQVIFSINYNILRNTISIIFSRQILSDMLRNTIQRKTLERFLQHTHHFRENYASSSENSFVIFSPPLSHYYTLRGDLYSNTTHTYSECRECFGAWEALGICQNKPVRLGGCNRAYCGIW